MDPEEAQERSCSYGGTLTMLRRLRVPARRPLRLLAATPLPLELERAEVLTGQLQQLAPLLPHAHALGEREPVVPRCVRAVRPRL